MNNPARLRDFVHAFTRLADAAAHDETRMLEQGRALLADLVMHDDWLPAAFAQPHPDRYQQYLLHCDPLGRFSVVSFVCGPGQATPVHDHTVWGMVGVLRGAEQCEEFAPPMGAGPLAALGAHHLAAGAIDIVSPSVGDIHRVSNASPGAVSVSIHVYGADIGRVERHVYDPASGAATRFVSGYSARATPESWQ
ncbi:cysteine dioxygenase [Massilia sp. CCM 8695]|uniref:Cysteine dioxygenase n=1 Tax=Massilia frigida TaxID=2609281 RepID=A0ABX0MZ50_9BURK|nr:cysteine dioxygenase [Massilia frigida]NHZ78315.1 cysteine dioxygenase [Massilia frigida]